MLNKKSWGLRKSQTGKDVHFIKHNDGYINVGLTSNNKVYLKINNEFNNEYDLSKYSTITPDLLDNIYESVCS